MRKIKQLNPLSAADIKRITGIIRSCNPRYDNGSIRDYRRARTICNVILSINDGKTAEQVAKENGISRSTVFNYISQYNMNPNFMIRDIKQRSELEQFEHDIAMALNRKHVTTYKAAYKIILETTKLEISYERAIHFLKTHDFQIGGKYNRFIHKRTLETKHRMKVNKTPKKEPVSNTIQEVKQVEKKTSQEVKQAEKQNTIEIANLYAIEDYGMRLAKKYLRENDYVSEDDKDRIVKVIKREFHIIESDETLKDVLERDNVFNPYY